ncbi:hypothetical protein Tco_0746072, partial [Tanacetum coccineum]
VMQRSDGIFISQDKYVADILKKFDFATVKTVSTPIKTNKALHKDEKAEDVDVHLYRSMTGSLMYLTASRPDIMFAVCACASFQVTPKVSHLHVVKRIFRYLKGQPKLGLWYPRDSPFNLEAFLDSDYAGASLDMKSTTGGCQFLGKRLIAWQCKKQTIVANSTTEAKYVAAANYETVIKEWEDKMERVATTASSLEAEELIQFWTSAKVKTVNGERQIQALVDKKKDKVLDLEKAKTAQAKEITSLKKREDASKQGRKIKDLDADAEVTLVDETQEMNNDSLMFDIVSAAEVVTTVSASVEIPDELTLAQTLIEIKTAKPKPVTTAATIVTSVRPRAKGIIFHDQEEQVPSFTKKKNSSSQSQLPQVKDKGKGKMVEPEVPLKKKDQVALDEEMTRNLKAQLQAKLIKEERLVRQKEEEANIALIESWDNTQAMMEAYFELAQRLQAEEQGEITIEERLRLFVELINRRKKYFGKLRAEEIRRKPPTKAQKRNQMFTYLKNMAGYKHSQLKRKSYDEIQKLFDKEMKRSDKSKKQKLDEHVEAEKDNDLEEEEMKKHMEIVQDEEEIAINVIPLATKPPMIVEYKIGINREDLETIWKLVKEKHGINRPVDEYERVLWGDMKIQKMNIKFRGGLLGLKDFKIFLELLLLRADGSSKRYSSMIKMLQGIDREDLETIWKLVKAKHENTRPEDNYERVLWGDLKRVGPCSSSEGSGHLVPREEGNALGWFYRAANTSRS